MKILKTNRFHKIGMTNNAKDREPFGVGKIASTGGCELHRNLMVSFSLLCVK